MAVLLRTEGDPLRIAEAARRKIFQIDADQPTLRIATLEALVVEAGSEMRFLTLLLSLFALVGFLLAVMGAFGVAAFSMSQRIPELALRAAIGARRSDLYRLVLQDGLKLALIGVVVGSLGALASTHLLSSFLYGVSPRDPVTFVLVASILLLACVLASLPPAYRAASIDPALPLRM